MCKGMVPMYVSGEEARGGENFCLLGTNFSLKAEARKMATKNQGRWWARVGRRVTITVGGNRRTN